eukprot:6199671-Pleurochrysis_carterae.AAC.3
MAREKPALNAGSRSNQADAERAESQCRHRLLRARSSHSPTAQPHRRTTARQDAQGDARASLETVLDVHRCAA